MFLYCLYPQKMILSQGLLWPVKMHSDTVWQLYHLLVRQVTSTVEHSVNLKSDASTSWTSFFIDCPTFQTIWPDVTYFLLNFNSFDLILKYSIKILLAPRIIWMLWHKCYTIVKTSKIVGILQITASQFSRFSSSLVVPIPHWFQEDFFPLDEIPWLFFLMKSYYIWVVE